MARFSARPPIVSTAGPSQPLAASGQLGGTGHAGRRQETGVLAGQDKASSARVGQAGCGALPESSRATLSSSVATRAQRGS